MRSLLSTRRFLVAFLTLQAVVYAFVPNACVSNVTKTPSICCPASQTNSAVCGGPQRGSCTFIKPTSQFIPRVFQIDDRVAWPTIYFKAVCNCEGRFYGPACDECWFGWTGPNCDIRKEIVRKDIRELNSTERQIFLGAVARTATWPSGYSVPVESDNFHSDPLTNPRFEPASVQYLTSFMHQYGGRRTLFKTNLNCERYGSLDFIHDGPGFLTWHRYFTLIVERMLQNIAQQVFGFDRLAVPYWDYTGMRSCDICNNQFIGAPGRNDQFGPRLDQRSIFYNRDEYCPQPNTQMQCFGCQAARPGKLTRRFRSYDFPDQRDIKFIMALPNMGAEGFCGSPETAGDNLWTHNKAHNLIDGSMCCTNTATNDPLFFLYHTQVDRIFSAWYDKYKPDISAYPQEAVRPGHCRECFMVDSIPPLRHADMFAEAKSFGYTYNDYTFGKHAQNGMSPVVVQ